MDGPCSKFCDAIEGAANEAGVCAFAIVYLSRMPHIAGACSVHVECATCLGETEEGLNGELYEALTTAFRKWMADNQLVAWTQNNN